MIAKLKELIVITKTIKKTVIIIIKKKGEKYDYREKQKEIYRFRENSRHTCPL